MTQTVEIPVLARQLRRARRNLATDTPFGPAWSATVEWVDELEGQARSMGLDPDTLAQEVPRRRRHGSA